MPNATTESVLQTVQNNDYRTSLVALRDKLAADIDSPETTARDRAGIVKQLQSVLADIESIPDAEKFAHTPLDQILGGSG
ncbi:hypothetical protein ACFY5D_16715 [Paeniglutamicibacter sp. NPDC012692]|uniref:hypothetical protein n=1 Tax=Paeniglutamicibacter sp. NPDC012692 TaxID=3364388 RepID=UPI00367763EE